MSGPLAGATGLEIEPDGLELRRLKQNVDLPALSARGWDPESRVFAPLADDPLFGYLRCERVRCPRAGESRRARALGVCDPCAKNFLWRVEKTAGTDEVEPLERFKTRPLLRHDQATTEQPLCLVCRTPGHERAARTKGLCTDCCRHRAARRQTAEEFVAGHERLGVPKPRPSFGRCLVDDCRRWATNDRGFCQVCYRRWKKIPLVKRAAAREGFLAAGPWQPPLDGWRAAMPVVPELVQWQLLAGLQLLIDPYGVTMALDRLAMAWAHVATTRVRSVRDLSELPGTYPSQRALEIAMIAARRLTTTPEEERAKDVWDLGVFGLGEKRAIDFTNLHQRWLRDAAKGYTIERLRVAVPQLAEWTRTKAIPADAEIRTVRALIGAGEGALKELAPGERAKLLELFRVLRATRARMDGTIGIEHVGATRNPEPTFTPPAFTPLPSVRAFNAGRAPHE